MSECEIKTQSKDETIENLFQQVNRGKLITNPEYQREYIYSNEKASSLIESVLMRIPIPTIYLCEEENGKRSVVDGQQRLRSFVNFIKNKFPLTKMEKYTELERKYFENLSEEQQGLIFNTSI